MATKAGILVVDDDPHFTKTLCDILKVKGYKTTATTAGKAALDIVKGQAPAVALIDLKLEDISGLKVMKGIGKYCPNTECIVLTGHASQESAIEAVNLGAYSYVQKPYRVEELMVTIRRAIEKQEAEQKLRQSEERYRSTLDNMLEGCQIIGYDWRYRYVNDAVARHGHTTKEKLLGKTMMEVYPGIEKTKMFAALQRCMQERISIHTENEFEFPDGEKGWFELSIQPVPEGVFVLSVDITERKQAEEERQQSIEKSQRSLRASVDALASAV